MLLYKSSSAVECLVVWLGVYIPNASENSERDCHSCSSRHIEIEICERPRSPQCVYIVCGVRRIVYGGVVIYGAQLCAVHCARCVELCVCYFARWAKRTHSNSLVKI